MDSHSFQRVVCLVHRDYAEVYLSGLQPLGKEYLDEAGHHPDRDGPHLVCSVTTGGNAHQAGQDAVGQTGNTLHMVDPHLEQEGGQAPCGRRECGVHAHHLDCNLVGTCGTQRRTTVEPLPPEPQNQRA